MRPRVCSSVRPTTPSMVCAAAGCEKDEGCAMSGTTRRPDESATSEDPWEAVQRLLGENDGKTAVRILRDAAGAGRLPRAARPLAW